MSTKLEIAILAGQETKQFLANLIEQIDRLEDLVSSIGNVDKKSTKVKGSTAAFDEDDEDAITDSQAEAEDDESSFDEKPAKSAAKKAKKLTVEDVTAACKKRAQATDFKSTKALLKKKFKVESVHDLKETQYAAVIEALTADLDEE